jgi:hypothetical protein
MLLVVVILWYIYIMNTYIYILCLINIYIYTSPTICPWCSMYGIFIYLHLPQKWPSHVGKYSSTMVRTWVCIYITEGNSSHPPNIHLPNESQYVDSSSAKDGCWMFPGILYIYILYIYICSWCPYTMPGFPSPEFLGPAVSEATWITRTAAACGSEAVVTGWIWDPAW